MKHKINHLSIGIFLIILSFGYWFLPITHSIIGIANAIFYVGNILVFDYLSERYSGYSLLKIRNRRKHFLVLGLLFGLILEFYMNWIGKFWYYPYWDLTFYIIILAPGFAAYSFYLLEAFLGTKAVLEHLFLKHRSPERFSGLKTIFTTAGILGTALLSAGTMYLIVSLPGKGWFEAFQINQPRTGNANNWYWYFIICIGMWLLLEFIEYQKHETSLIYQIIKGNYWPLIAIFIAGIISAILYEIFNVPGGLWRYEYSSAPFSNIQIMGFPFMMFIGWPFHYLPVISLYRILYKKETEKLWR